MTLLETILRKKIAEEIKANFMPICICEPCGTVATASLVQAIIDKVQDSKAEPFISTAQLDMLDRQGRSPSSNTQ